MKKSLLLLVALMALVVAASAADKAAPAEAQSPPGWNSTERPMPAFPQPSYVQPDQKVMGAAERASRLANERAAKANGFDKLKVGKYGDLDRVKRSADIGRNRAKDELASLAAKSGSAPGSVAAAAVGESARQDMKGRLVLAVSSSMPEQMLREYMAQLDGHPEAIVVMRGFVGGASKVVPTGLLIEKIRQLVPGSREKGHRNVQVVVDPLVFRSLGIDQVPAVAWLPGVKDLAHCDGEVLKAAVVVYGAVKVTAALDRINREGGNVPADLIKRMGG